MKKSRKSIFLILLSALTLLLFSCNSWMTDDGFFSSIEKDVKVANAPQISVYVRYAMTKQGKTDPDGPATLKVEIPYSISATTETEYGFVRWAAFSTDFLTTGDNQSLNKDVIFNDDDDYNTRLLPHEIKSPIVVFEDATKPSTMVTINEMRNDIFLVPIVTQRPQISVTIPARGTSNVVRNMSVRLNFSKAMDIESFKNSEGAFDKITITQGNTTFNSDGEIDIESEDITDRFDISLSRNKKMLTIKFKTEALSEGFAAQSSVNINVSKEVKDLWGFSMTDDDKVTFSVGTARDSLAPYIVQLTGGTGFLTGNVANSPRINYDTFMGVYKDADCTATGSAISKIDYDGAVNAPTDNYAATWYDSEIKTNANGTQTTINKNFYNNRVGGKIILRVVAKDIAGSDDSTQVNEQTSNELDVQAIGIRAKHLFNASDGSASDVDMSDVTAYAYAPKTNRTSITGSYTDLVKDSSDTTDNSTEGCLLEYDLSGLPDGLIRIDVGAVDIVGNNGFSDGGLYSSKFGNAWTSLFVVKDTTAPDASANLNYVAPELSGTVPTGFDNFYNASTYQSIVVKESSSHIIRDQGTTKFTSGTYDGTNNTHGYGNLKWMFRATTDLGWTSTVSKNDSGWALISDTNGYNFQNFSLPTEQGTVSLSYALMDDLGNISSAVALNSINYDDVAPAISGLTMPSIISSNSIDLQFTALEVTSGIKTLEVSSVRVGGGTYGSPLTNAEVWVDGTQKTIGSDYTVSGKIITFATPLITSASGANIQLKHVTIDSVQQDGRYNISVKPKDRALNEPTSVPDVEIIRDETAPTIHKVESAATLKTAKVFSGATPSGTAVYWTDAADLSSGLASLKVTFTENNSGAKIFDFGSSTFTVTASSQIIDATTGTVYARESSITGNKLTLTNALRSPDNGSSLTVIISGIQLTDASTGNTLDLKIYDAAGNTPATAKTTYYINSTTEISTFRYDSAAPDFSGDLTLKDRSTDNWNSNTTNWDAADIEYTNEANVNVTFSSTPATSGVYKITVSGASFNTSGINQTGVYVSSSGTSYTQVDSSYYTISSNTIEFKSGSDRALFNSATAFKLTNVLLPGGDSNPAGLAPTSVNFTLTSMGGTSSSKSDSIILDMQAPVWGSDSLYTTDTSEYIYPRVTEGTTRARGLTGIDSSHPEEIYFYSNGSVINIYADFTDQNLTANTDNCLYLNLESGAVSGLSSGMNGPYPYISLAPSQNLKFTVYVRDKAGNHTTTTKTFHIVYDSAFANSTDEENAINNYMVLYKPSGTNVFRNPTNNGGNTSYIIKGGQQYQIRIRLDGSTAESGEEALEGGTPSYSGAYTRKDNTTTSSKIEKYYVSTNPNLNNNLWQNYNGGTITINLPTSNEDDCQPRILFLKDACGNTAERHIRPASMGNSFVQWVVDSQVGLPDYPGTSNINYTTGASIKSDIVFYNGTNTTTPTLSTGAWSDTARFNNIGTGAAGDSTAYTLKSRIIAWTDTGSNPTRTSFDNSSLGEDWYYWREGKASSIIIAPSTAFSLSNNFPAYASSTAYRLFYCVEDAVGNSIIKQIKINPDTYSIYLTEDFADNSGLGLFLYDNTAPAVNANSYGFTNVNQISNNGTLTNYFSDNSSVAYTINETGSGICNDGNGDVTYPGFDSTSRKHGTAVLVTYSLTGKTTNGSNLQISGIKDFAGNEITNAINLTNGTSSTWVKQSEPVLNTSVITAEIASNFGYVWPELVDGGDTETNGQYLKIRAKSSTISIKLTLGVNDSTPLMGWIISTNKNLYSTSAFYEPSSSISSAMTYVDTSNTYTYTYSKGLDWTTQWKDDTAGATKYFYPVNRAGLIGKPVKVEFVANDIPSITDLTYNNYGTVAINTTEDAPTNYTITSEESESSANYYLKAGAKIRFTTVNSPNSARIYYGTGTNDYVKYTLSDFLVSGSTYEIGVNNTGKDGPSTTANTTLAAHLTATTPKALKLTVHTAYEDSGDNQLTGPATGPQVNHWLYDDVVPSLTDSIVFKSVDYPSSGTDTNAASSENSEDSTKYIQSATAKVTLSASDTGSGIAHYQYKADSGTWTNITASNTGVVTLSAPADKTEYKFRVVDHAGNISNISTGVTIQRDDQGPTGTFSYITQNTNGDNNLTDKPSAAAPLDAPYDNEGTQTPDSDIRYIRYSSNNQSAYWLTKIHTSFTITDTRSGLQGYQVTKQTGDNGTPSDLATPTTLSSTATSYDIDLSGNNENTVYIYKIYAVDNINQKTLLKTFRTKDDKTGPTLTAAATNWIVATDDNGANSVAAERYPADTGTYYLKNAKAVISFTIDENDADYQWRTSETTWASSNDYVTVTKTGSNLTYTFAAPPAPTTYYFRGVDRLGNPSTSANITANTITVQKDMWAPSGDLTYSLKESADSTSGKSLSQGLDSAYNSDENYRDIKYSSISGTTNYISVVDIDLHAITDDVDNQARSGIEGFYLATDGGTATKIQSASISSEGIYQITLPTSGSKIYVFSVKDNIGYSRNLKTFKFTADNAKPDLGLATNPVTTDSSKTVSYNSTNTTYYVNGTHAIINLTKASTTTDIAYYMIKRGSADWDTIYLTDTNLSQESTTVTYTIDLSALAEPATAITYQIYAVDTVGNESTNTRSVTIAQDTAGPAGTFGYTFTTTDSKKTENTNAETNTITIGYNKSAASTIDFTFTDISEAAGYDKLYYKLNDGTATAMTSNTISGLNNLENGSTYEIIAKDVLGNETSLKTFVFRGVSGGPKVAATKHPQYSGLQYVPTYPKVDNPNAKTGDTWTYKDTNWIKAFDADTDVFFLTEGGTDILTEPTVTVKIFGYNSDGTPKDGDTANTVPSSYNVRQIKGSAVKFKLPVMSTSLPSDKLYYGISYNTTADPTWSSEPVDVVTNNGKSCIENIPLDLNQITKRHTFIFVWYKDELDNISVYNLTHPAATGQNWWTTDASAGTSGDFSDLTGDTAAFVYRSAGTTTGKGRGNRILGGDAADSEKPLTRVVEWLSSIQDAFTNDAEVAANPVKTSKKEAKKASKKSAKKAKKTVAAAETSVTANPPAAKALDIAPIELKEESVEVTTPETSATEKLTTEEITTVAAESTSVESVETQTVESAEATSVKSAEKSSSKAPVIVVMLAILSACGGAWFTRKRKDEAR